ncbi:MAG: hypothetical protein ACR2KT_12885, partial [Methylocella sp.]
MKDEKRPHGRPPSREGKRTFSVYLKPEALPEAARAAVKRPRRTMRVIQGAVTISEQDRPDIAYQHSVLC